MMTRIQNLPLELLAEILAHSPVPSVLRLVQVKRQLLTRGYIH